MAIIAMLLASPAFAAVADRDLGVATDEHEAFVVAGPRVRPTEDRVVLTGAFGYRYGLTDHLEYQLPLRMGYHVHSAAGDALSISGGVAGFGIDREDGTHYTLPLLLSLAAKLRLGGAALVTSLSGTLIKDLSGGEDERSARLSVSVIFDVSRAISLSVGASGQLTAEADGSHRYDLSVFGLGSDGYAPIPFLWWHATEHVSLVLSPALGRDVSRGLTSYGGTVGVFIRL